MANRYGQLIQSRADARKALRALLDAAVDVETKTPRELTAEEATQAAAFEARITAVGAEIDREERLRAAEAAGSAQPIHTHDLSVDRPWRNFGEYLQAVHKAHSGGAHDPRLFAVATGMGEHVGADGGFAVPVQFAAGIEKEMWDTGQLLSRVNERPIEGNAMTFNVIDETSRADGSRRGGVLGYWVDEGTAPTATQIKLAKIEMKLRKVAALGYLTDELMADAPALAAELQEAFTEELLFQVENTIINGTGAGQPLGILKAPSLVSVAKETGQSAATLLTRNLSNMWARIPARSKANVVWVGNVDIEPELDQLTIPAGTAAVEPRFVTYGPEGTLRIKGRPFFTVEYCATLGTKGDLLAVDLSRYRLIRKAVGVETASSMHVRFTQGEQAFRAIYRVDGQPLPRSAITPFKGTATLSPFVSLDTRA